MEDYKTKNFLNDDKNNKIEETVRNTHCCEYTTITQEYPTLFGQIVEMAKK
jgi:hypothetical protein